MGWVTQGRALVAAVAILTSGPAAVSAAAQAVPTSAGPGASASAVAPAVSRHNCGRTIRTVYHSCVFGRHVAGVYRKRAGHGYFSAQLISAHSGRAYQVECNGWDAITCYTDSGRITFRVSRIRG